MRFTAKLEMRTLQKHLKCAEGRKNSIWIHAGKVTTAPRWWQNSVYERNYAGKIMAEIKV